jgi:hypothetical protein
MCITAALVANNASPQDVHHRGARLARKKIIDESNGAH